MRKECQIKCKVSPGLFEDEVVARIQALGSDRSIGTVTVIVSKDNISFKGTHGKHDALRAYCTKTGGSFAAVVLPQTSMENGQSVIVPSSQVIRK